MSTCRPWQLKLARSRLDFQSHIALISKQTMMDRGQEVFRTLVTLVLLSLSLAGSFSPSDSVLLQLCPSTPLSTQRLCIRPSRCGPNGTNVNSLKRSPVQLITSGRGSQTYGKETVYKRSSWRRVVIMFVCSPAADLSNPAAITISDISPIPKSRNILFIHNIHSCCRNVLIFCAEHGSDTAVLCAKFQKRFNNCYGGNEISRELSLSYVSEKFPILQQPPTLMIPWPETGEHEHLLRQNNAVVVHDSTGSIDRRAQ